MNNSVCSQASPSNIPTRTVTCAASNHSNNGNACLREVPIRSRNCAGVIPPPSRNAASNNPRIALICPVRYKSPPDLNHSAGRKQRASNAWCKPVILANFISFATRSDRSDGKQQKELPRTRAARPHRKKHAEAPLLTQA